MERLDAVVLAGGFARRMWPLTRDRPKQLLPLAGRPMLAHVLEKLEPLAAAGQLGRVFISTNQVFADRFKTYLDSYVAGDPAGHGTDVRDSSADSRGGHPLHEPSGSPDGPEQQWTDGLLPDLRLIIEPAREEGQKLGSLGALGRLFEQQGLGGPLMILGSDNLYDFSLEPLVRTHADTGLDVVGLYDVEDIKRARLYGIAALDDEGRLTNFVEKPADPPSTLAATALWLLSPKGVQALLDYLAAGHDCDALGNFLAWRIEHAPVMGHAYTGIWYDIGSLESYAEARRWLEG